MIERDANIYQQHCLSYIVCSDFGRVCTVISNISFIFIILLNVYFYYFYFISVVI